MTSKARVIEFHPDHIPFVADNLREEDRREIAAVTTLPPLEAIIESVRVSTLVWSILLEDHVIGIFGVGALNPDSPIGYPWLLATPEIEKISITFLRQSRSCIEKMLEHHTLLENWVDVRNSVSIRWLEWCGFTILPPEPFGINGDLFHRFELRR